MKILMISHFVPYPPNTGALQRNYNLLREIAKVHEIYMVTLTQKALLPTDTLVREATKEISNFCKSIKVFDIPTDSHPLKWYALLLLNIFSRNPYSVKRFYSSEMEKEIKRILKEIPIDLIHVDTIDLAQYAENIDTVPKVMNHHNIESQLLFRRAEHAGNGLSKWYLTLQAKKVRNYEKLMIPLFDGNIAVSPLDQADITSLSQNKPTALVSNGTDTGYFTPSVNPQENTLIFAGGLNWLPNAEAMLHFCTVIFPLIQTEFPEVKIKIIGTNPSVDLKETAKKNSAIEILGFVPDIREYMAMAAVHVVPLRIGGGTRLKILDALAMGKAVVSTTIGAEGLDLTDGTDILIADKDEAFAQKVVLLLKNPALRAVLGKNGRATIEKKYSWNVIGPKLLDVYSEVFKRKMTERN